MARKGGSAEEQRLFAVLTDIFRLFVQQRVWSRQDCEEIVQETLTTIAEKYRGIEFETSFAAWAYRVLEHKILHYYRTKRCRESKFAHPPEGVEIATTEPFNPNLKRKLLDCLRQISRGNRRHARILTLRYQGFSAEEICDKLRITRNNAYIILSRARAMLKRCLKEGAEKP